MVKRVFSNAAECIHVWAQQNQNEGRASNVFFEGPVIYSYGYHYPLAVFIESPIKANGKAVFVHTSGYSVSTHKHITQVQGATNHYNQFRVGNPTLINALKRNSGGWHDGTDLLANEFNRQVQAEVMHLQGFLGSPESAKRRRATLEKIKGQTAYKIQNYIAMMEWLGLKLDAKSKKAIKSLDSSIDDLKASAQKVAALEAKQKAKAEKERLARNAIATKTALESFHNGADLSHVEYGYLYTVKPIQMRVISDEIQTTMRASFPVEHALKAFPFIRACKEKGTSWQRGDKSLRLGSYTKEAIEERGNVKAGCHYLEWEEIERLAKQLKVYP